MNVAVLSALLAVDLALILVHGLLGLLVLTGTLDTFPERLRIDRDWGLAEIFGYLKWIWLAAILLGQYRQTKAVIFFGLGALCLLALADDSLQLHENFGSVIFPRLGLHTILPSGSGEIVFLGLVGLLIILPLTAGWLRAAPALRSQLAPFLLLFCGVAFCVAIIDFIHSQLADRSALAGLFGMLEDGGEMVFMSLMVAYAAGALRIRPESRSS